MLSVLGSEDDKITALDLGADDYLTKPFLAGELTARLRALLRRAAPGDSSLSEMVAGDLEIDFARRTVSVRGARVHLTRTEFDILALLARNADRVVTSTMLLEQVWGPEYVGDTQTLRTHVSHLRRKIERPGDVPAAHPDRARGRLPVRGGVDGLSRARRPAISTQSSHLRRGTQRGVNTASRTIL